MLSIIHHPSFLLHEMGPDHPECPDRLRAVHHLLQQQPWFPKLNMLLATVAGDDSLLAAHSQAALDRAVMLSPSTGYAMLDGDTLMNSHSLTAAQLAAGAGILAVDRVLAENAQGPHRAFCAVRPPGHHAEHGRSMGFCIFNNIAVAAHHAFKKHGLARVAIIDFDVHHGNGTENIFAGDERVLMLSTFQSPFYPYSGDIPSGSNIVNVPIAEGESGLALKRAALGPWQAALEKFQPELIFVSAGFDAHKADPLGGLAWEVEDYAWVTQWIVDRSNEHCDGRIVSMLEGGYHLNALAHSVCAHIEVMLGVSLATLWCDTK
jgi:acetoin utilization deacetylase AcuC-like enzyme